MPLQKRRGVQGGAGRGPGRGKARSPVCCGLHQRCQGKSSDPEPRGGLCKTNNETECRALGLLPALATHPCITATTLLIIVAHRDNYCHFQPGSLLNPCPRQSFHVAAGETKNVTPTQPSPCWDPPVTAHRVQDKIQCPTQAPSLRRRLYFLLRCSGLPGKTSFFQFLK